MRAIKGTPHGLSFSVTLTVGPEGPQRRRRRPWWGPWRAGTPTVVGTGIFSFMVRLWAWGPHRTHHEGNASDRHDGGPPL